MRSRRSRRPTAANWRCSRAGRFGRAATQETKKSGTFVFQEWGMIKLRRRATTPASKQELFGKDVRSN
jgi:hypothetical protein